MLKKTIFISLFSLLLCFGLNSYAENSNATQELIKLLQNTRTMQADFVQKIYDENGSVIDTSNGTLVLSKPNKFRWQVVNPMNQLVVSNGSKIWTYDADLAQVVIKPVNQAIAATPLAILSGSTEALGKGYVITKQGDSYKLVVKQQETNFTTIILKFSNGAISGMTLFDNLGQKTQLEFTEVKINLPVKTSDFQFTPPKGVDVIKQ